MSKHSNCQHILFIKSRDMHGTPTFASCIDAHIVIYRPLFCVTRSTQLRDMKPTVNCHTGIQALSSRPSICRPSYNKFDRPFDTARGHNCTRLPFNPRASIQTFQPVFTPTDPSIRGELHRLRQLESSTNYIHIIFCSRF